MAKFHTGDQVALMFQHRLYKTTVTTANENVAVVDGHTFIQWSGREEVAAYQPAKRMIWPWGASDDRRLELQEAGIVAIPDIPC
jgi:hypothetical protein